MGRWLIAASTSLVLAGASGLEARLPSVDAEPTSNSQPANQVPESATLVLFGLGLSAVAYRLRGGLKQKQ